MKTVFVKGSCFAGQPATAENTAFVETDGNVSVSDGVGQIRSTCHSLTADQLEMIRNARPYQTVSF